METENLKSENRPELLGCYFGLSEFVYSRMAIENGLDNTPPPEAVEALRYLVRELLDPLRTLYGRPIHINSGYRSEALNRLVKGVPNSQHRLGEAADLYAEEPKELLEILLESSLPFDQAILYRTKRFLHLSLKRRGKNRRQLLYR